MAEIDVQVSPEKAREILLAAKSVGQYDREVPDKEELLLGHATTLVNWAIEAYESGMKGDAVTEILATYNFGEQPSEVEAEIKSDDDFYKEAKSFIPPDGLPIPSEIEGNPPTLPLDLEDISTKELIRLHGQFNACFSRANFLYAIEEAGERAAKKIADSYYYKYVAECDRKDPHTNKPKTLDILKAETGEKYEQYRFWIDRKEEHGIKAGKFKRLKDIYEENIEALSRQFTMRQSERDNLK